jgi:hypothetical protein
LEGLSKVRTEALELREHMEVLVVVDAGHGCRPLGLLVYQHPRAPSRPGCGTRGRLTGRPRRASPGSHLRISYELHRGTAALPGDDPLCPGRTTGSSASTSRRAPSSRFAWLVSAPVTASKCALLLGHEFPCPLRRARLSRRGRGSAGRGEEGTPAGPPLPIVRPIAARESERGARRAPLSPPFIHVSCARARRCVVEGGAGCRG